LKKVVGNRKIPEEAAGAAFVDRYDVNIVRDAGRKDGVETVGGGPIGPATDERSQDSIRGADVNVESVIDIRVDRKRTGECGCYRKCQTSEVTDPHETHSIGCNE
jgi:hypothetical protein